jgi:hypothetical protein
VPPMKCHNLTYGLHCQVTDKWISIQSLCDTKCCHRAPLRNISLVESYHMWCDLSLGRIYFSITNSSYPSNQCCPLNSLLGIYTASPVITSLFKAFPQVHCLKLGKWVLQFYLDHTKSPTFIRHFDACRKKEFTEHRI